MTPTKRLWSYVLYVSCLGKSSVSRIEQEVTVPLFDATNIGQFMETENTIYRHSLHAEYPQPCYFLLSSEGERCEEKQHVSGPGSLPTQPPFRKVSVTVTFYMDLGVVLAFSVVFQFGTLWRER